MFRIPVIFSKITKNFIELIQYISIICNPALIHNLDLIPGRKEGVKNYIDIDWFKKF